jgi:hypothetical protein
MTAMRAKVRLTGIKPYPEEGDTTQETLTFNFPAKDGAYPADGSDEDQQFARFSPSGSLELTVANPNLIGKFAIGDTFYLDFTPAA